MSIPPTVPAQTVQIADYIPVVIATIGAIISLITLLSQRRKDKAEAKKAEADAARTDSERQKLEDEITERVLARAREDMQRMQAEIDDLRSELMRYQEWATRLTKQVRALGGEPVPMPRKGQ